MRIGYFADGPWSHKALEAISADSSLEICFIVPRFDTQDPVLAQWAEKLDIDFLPIQNVNSPEALSCLEKYEADIYVSMSFNQILKKNFLTQTKLGVINCHAGALPFYRGRNILNWALINGERSFGITVHYVDEGIDTGDIISQKIIQIHDSDTYGTLLEMAIASCASLLYESLKTIQAGKANRVPQSSIHPVGSYFSRRRDGDEFIDWNWDSLRIFNFVRAISSPGPLARALMQGATIKIEHAELIPHSVPYISQPGEILQISERGLVVKTGDSIILVRPNTVLPTPLLRIGNRFDTASFSEYVKLKSRVESLEKEILEIRAIIK